MRQPPTEQHWRAHLAGEGPYLGVVPITTRNTCYFGALDLDDEAADHLKLDQQVRELRLPLIVCRSKSGGAHLYVFTSEPVAAGNLVKKLKRWRDALGLQNPPDEQGRRPPVEVFPKQTHTKQDDLGNWINLPYYGGDETDRYAVVGGQQLDLEQFLDTAETKRLSAAALEAREADMPPTSQTFFADGPPCLQTLHTTGGFTAGNRNLGLYNVGIFLKLKFPDDWEERVYDYNEAQLDPPLDDDEVEDVVRSLQRKDYIYKCNDAPIVGVCDRRACKKKMYGIDRFRKKRVQSQLPQLGPLEKHLTNPPYYVLRVDGKPVKLTADELMQQQKTTTQVFMQADLVMPSMKVAEWKDMVRDLTAEMIQVEAPVDAGLLGQLKVRLREFLQLRHRSENREGLLQGKPWGQNGKVYFRSSDLLEYLERKRVRGYRDPQEVWAALRNMGAGSTQFEMKGATVDVWFVPTPELEQTEEFSLPEGTEEIF